MGIIMHIIIMPMGMEAIMEIMAARCERAVEDNGGVMKEKILFKRVSENKKSGTC